MTAALLSPDLPSLELSSSTSSSSASSVSSVHTRRIRFAPLPDPRALDDDDDDDGDDVRDDHPHLHLPAVPDLKPCLLSCSPTSDNGPHSPITAKPTTQQLLSHPPVAHPPSWTKPKTLNLLRPFPFNKRSSVPPTSSGASLHSLTPTQSNDSSPTPTNPTPPASSTSFSATEILTLGTIKLFRPSSKSANPEPKPEPSSPSSWGFGLTRWSSAGSHSGKQGTPLTRSQSVQSQTYTPSISSKLRLGSSSKSSSSKVPATKPRSSSVASTRSVPSDTTSKPLAKTTSAPGRKGTRMLNGRVYGAKHKHLRDPNANPFANARDDDPEFVEWGYGGMGSVRGGRHAGVTDDSTGGKGRTQWERLQSDATYLGAGTSEKKGIGGAQSAGEDDDGSGMGWVRKRKEQREREKKEKEEKERAEQEQKDNPPTEEPALEALSISVPPLPDDSTPPSLVSAPVAPSESLTSPLPNPPVSAPIPVLEHNLTAVTLPVHLSRHHSYHRRTISRNASAEGVPTVSGIGTGETAVMPLGTTPESHREASESSESETEEEDNVPRKSKDDDDDDESDDDEEEEDEETERRRKTALGAGVEKISRHHD